MAFHTIYNLQFYVNAVNVNVIFATLFHASRQAVWFRVLYDVPHMHNNVRDEDNLWCKDNLCYYMDRT